jgi:hypothetical protein
MTVLTVNVVGAVAPGGPPAQERSLREILHTPPLVLGREDAVRLRYDVVCARDELGTPCSPAGTAYVRPQGDRAYMEVPLSSDGDAALSTSLPARFARAGGIEYYAVVESGGESLTLPPGGPAAPHRATVVPSWIDVELGAHRFGAATAPDRRIASARWGRGDRELGLDTGPEQARIGPSAFDVPGDGSVVVLDQVNRRLAVFKRGGGAVRHVPIPFSGGEGDLAVERDGTVHVLDEGGTARRGPVVRTFGAAGDLRSSIPLAARSADMLRLGPDGPIAHAYPAESWLPARSGRAALSPAEQVARSRQARLFGGGEEVLVRASPNEARFALVRGDKAVRSWRVAGETTLGEVQLAEPYGNGLLVVLREWTETEAEFSVLELTPSGLRRSFSVERAEWAESGPLSRFRLDGDSLYQLRSAPSGVEIVAFDLGGTR